MKLTVAGVEYERRDNGLWIDRNQYSAGTFGSACLDALAAAEQSRAAQVVEIASLRADRDRCADHYQQEKAARIVAESERDRWRKLATDARPFVYTTDVDGFVVKERQDWCDRFDAALGATK